MIQKQTILIVDDHPLLRRGLRDLIASDEALKVCGEAAGAPEALTLAGTLKPDLMIVDLSLASGSGIELIKQLRINHPQLPVLVLSIHMEAQFAERALRAGARGYLNKSEAISDILKAIHQVLQGEIYLTQETAEHMFLVKEMPHETLTSKQPKDGVQRLTDREFEIFQLIASGLGTRQISEKLNVSVKTIEAHRANLKKKLHLNSGTELVQYAIRWALERETFP